MESANFLEELFDLLAAAKFRIASVPEAGLRRVEPRAAEPLRVLEYLRYQIGTARAFFESEEVAKLGRVRRDDVLRLLLQVDVVGGFEEHLEVLREVIVLGVAGSRAEGVSIEFQVGFVEHFRFGVD